ncbi:MAG: hypothetical protein CK548_03780 [Opitutia bacterium]|nr:MAG: hypothetical protein CK548_03780 [Opitutae bacterium]
MQSPSAPAGLKSREYVGYALGDTASNLFFQTFGIFLTYFYTDVWASRLRAIRHKADQGIDWAFVPESYAVTHE